MKKDAIMFGNKKQLEKINLIKLIGVSMTAIGVIFTAIGECRIISTVRSFTGCTKASNDCIHKLFKHFDKISK